MIDVLLLLALPASGKSEIRRYLESLDLEGLRSLGIGSTIQLDDFPYVHLMRRVSREIVELGLEPPYFATDEEPFLDPRDWGTLVHLVNEDFAYLTCPPTLGGSAGRWLTDRLAAARSKVGADAYFPSLRADARRSVEAAIELEAESLFDDVVQRRWESGHTIVIEFARGMPIGSVCPPLAPMGYGYSLSLLAPEIVRRARILYVQVSPDESRRRNRERTVVGEEGSILHHGVPEQVMLNDYGSDDFMWLLDAAGRPGTVDIEIGGTTHHIPAAVFDNRRDLTSFLRAERESWGRRDLAVLREALEEAFAKLRG